MAKKTIESEIDFNKEALRYYKGYLPRLIDSEKRNECETLIKKHEKALEKLYKKQNDKTGY